jgi:hypothetical protein
MGGGVVVTFVKLDWDTIREDPQHNVLLVAAADQIIADASGLTSVPITWKRSEPQDGEIVIGAVRSPGAVAAEFGTRYRPARRMIQRASQSLGIEIS